MALIEPRTLKGFRDYLPEQAIPREALIEKARGIFRSYGFLPIDTPALEYEEILTGKGGEESDKQLYRFEDSGGRKVALRFDLTVPLARFVAQHSSELGLPFKRYHIATVWRGENTQRGRYREFMQCDFDTIGTESMVADVETILVIHDLLRSIGIERFTIRINDRKYLTTLLNSYEFTEKQVEVLRMLDKLDKIGEDGVVAGIVGLGFKDFRAQELIRALSALELGGHFTAVDDIRDRLQGVRNSVLAAGVPAERVVLDHSIARGLDYYTGIVFETRLEGLPSIGSVCSGGRYDNLAQLYTKERLPGVGASLGLDRLLAAMEELQLLPKTSATAPVFLAYFDRITRATTCASRPTCAPPASASSSIPSRRSSARSSSTPIAAASGSPSSSARTSGRAAPASSRISRARRRARSPSAAPTASPLPSSSAALR
jgi:histidyl-tRNA synthetase